MALEVEVGEEGEAGGWLVPDSEPAGPKQAGFNPETVAGSGERGAEQEAAQPAASGADGRRGYLLHAAGARLTWVWERLSDGGMRGCWSG